MRLPALILALFSQWCNLLGLYGPAGSFKARVDINLCACNLVCTITANNFQFD